MILERLYFKTLPDAWSILGAVIIVGGALRVALAKQAPKTPKEVEADAKAEREALGSAESDEEEIGITVQGRERSGSGVAAARGIDVER